MLQGNRSWTKFSESWKFEKETPPGTRDTPVLSSTTEGLTEIGTHLFLEVNPPDMGHTKLPGRLSTRTIKSVFKVYWFPVSLHMTFCNHFWSAQPKLSDHYFQNPIPATQPTRGVTIWALLRPSRLTVSELSLMWVWSKLQGRSKQSSWPYPNQYQDGKPQSRTSNILQSPKAGHKTEISFAPSKSI